MALTISEAQAVNDVLRFFLKDKRDDQGVDPERAKVAAFLLVGKANKALMAGYSERSLAEIWDKKVGVRA